jgi:hypothetical protein
MILPEGTSAEDFATYIATNKPYLIEIEDEIQKMGNFGEMELKISIRGGRVEKVQFWKGKIWLREKDLTQLPTHDTK